MGRKPEARLGPELDTQTSIPGQKQVTQSLRRMECLTSFQTQELKVIILEERTSHSSFGLNGTSMAPNFTPSLPTEGRPSGEGGFHVDPHQFHTDMIPRQPLKAAVPPVSTLRGSHRECSTSGPCFSTNAHLR